MKAFMKNIISIITVLCTMLILLSFSAFANDGWTYANSLPSGVTSSKYIIQYNNVYRTTAKSSPGTGWVSKGYSHSQYENYGEPYYSNIELPVSDTRVVLSYSYYHWCGAGTGTRVNFDMYGSYNHYDGIAASASFYEAAAYADDDDPRYIAYHLKYYDGSNVMCRSGFSCDGAHGSHGARSYIWYKTTRYQDRIRVDYYTYEKQSGWVSSADSTASYYTVRYKLKESTPTTTNPTQPAHSHSYGDWKVTAKASFKKDGSKYRVCSSCKGKQTAKIEKLSSVKLSATSYDYNGKVKKPSVTVKNSAGTKIDTKYYSVKYSGERKNIGTYKVTVKLKGKYYSGTTTLKFKIVPAKVKKVKAKAGKNTVTLQWSKSSGSNIKYKVYSYNTSTKKTKLLQTTGNTKVTFKSLKTGEKYSYKVKATKKIGDTTYSSKDSSVVSAQPYGKPAKVTGIKVSGETSTSVNLEWKKVKGSKIIYYVYHYNTSNGKYTSIGKINDNKCTIKDLKPSKSYKYAIRAYYSAGDGYYGSYSDIITVKTKAKLTSPDMSAISLSTERKLNNVLIKWTANSNATGYEIYRSTTGKSDSYKLLKKIESSSVSSFADTTVSPAKTYYYKVRTYKIRGTESKKGAFCTAQKITTYAAWKERMYVTDMSFSFVNSSRDFGYAENYVIPLSSYQFIFGNTTLAKQLYNKDREAGRVWGGNCYGMSAASGLFNVRSSGIRITDFNSIATKPSDLKVEDFSSSLGINLKTFIEALQVSQKSSYISQNRIVNDLEGLYNAVCRVSYTGKPVMVSVVRNHEGHALLAYWAYHPNNSEIRIQLYDCNHPNEDRELVLYKDSKGKITGWFYDLGFSEPTYYGTNYPESTIRYLEYDIYSSMWTNRGSIDSSAAKTNTLISNSDDISIYGEDNTLIATVTDGELVSNVDDIYIADESVVNPDTVMLYLPTDCTYTVVNNDESMDVFEATMVNVDRSAEISTESDYVIFNVSDKEEINSVCVDAEKGEDYTIVLEHSESLNLDTIEILGTGNGETVSVEGDGEKLSFDNCENSVVNITN